MKHLTKKALPLLLAILLITGLAAPALATQHSFSDVPAGAWFADAVQYVYEHNIMGGVGGNRFDPGSDVTREQFAAMMYRYTELAEGNTEVPDDFDLSRFQDRDRLSSWAETYMYWANYNELITGTTATTLSPQGDATRAQGAAILYRFAAVFG